MLQSTPETKLTVEAANAAAGELSDRVHLVTRLFERDARFQTRERRIDRAVVPRHVGGRQDNQRLPDLGGSSVERAVCWQYADDRVPFVVQENAGARQY